MTAYQNVLVDIENGVGTVTLNRPEKLNALSGELRDDLREALYDLNPGDAVRVIRLKSSGRAFCAGYDLTPGAQLEPSQVAPMGDQAWELGESRIGPDRESLRDSIERWMWMWSYRKPIIAQVNGFCLSGGLDLIGACDIVFAADDATFGHPAARALGTLPTLGMLPLKIGAARTKEMMFTGDTITGEEAARIGLANRAIPAAQLEEETLAFCRRVAMVPLDALTAHKHHINRWMENAGIRTSAAAGADFDAIYHETPSFSRFVRIAAERGLKSALEWRDAPFR